MKIKGSNVQILINIIFVLTIFFNKELWQHLIQIINAKNNSLIAADIGYVFPQLLFYATSISFLFFCFSKEIRLDSKYTKINANLNFISLFLLFLTFIFLEIFSIFFSNVPHTVFTTGIITFIVIGLIYVANLYTLFEFDKARQLTQDSIGSNGFTQLMAYAVNGDTENLQNEIAKNNIDDVDDKGYTALMYASANGHSDCVSLLLDSGADKTIVTSKGNKAVDFAEMNNHFKARDMLR
jgi:ankyrin repeat protein